MLDMIWGDLQKEWDFLADSIVIVMCFAFVLIVCGRLFERKINRKRVMYLAVFSIYMLVMLQEVFFSRVDGSRAESIDWEILPNWREDIWRCVYAVENVIMMIPFGIFFPMMAKRLSKVYVCVPAGTLLSVGIETAQFLTGRGYCQLEDVVMNTTGTLIGFLLWFCGDKIWRGLKKKRKEL